MAWPWIDDDVLSLLSLDDVAGISESLLLCNDALSNCLTVASVDQVSSGPTPEDELASVYTAHIIDTANSQIRHE